MVMSLSNRASHHSPPYFRSGASHSNGASIFGGSSTCPGKGWSTSSSDSSSEESSSHGGLGDRGGILVYITLSYSLCSSFGFSGWIKVGENASPKTDQKCRLGSCIIHRLSFAVVPQDEGYPLRFPHSLVVTSLTPLSVRMMISSIDSRGPSASYMGFLPICPT
jgi:hypothetical protein